MTDWAQKDIAEKALASTLLRTVDFLKFAETKNAALLTFASAWLLALASLMAGDRLTDRGSRIAIAVALLLFAFAALIALFSFLPQLNLLKFFQDPSRNKSLLYFNDIAQLETTTYAQQFRERYASDPEQTVSASYLHDLAVQVSAISNITRRKFTIFNVGAAFVIAALVVLTARGAFVFYGYLLS